MTLLTLIGILIIILLIGLAYLVFQIKRNHKVYDIRTNWLYTNDNRWYEYTYDYMYTPAKHNWYGLKYPQDSDYLSK